MEESVSMVTIAGGNTKWYSHIKKNLVFSYKIKHTLTIQTSNPTENYLYKGNESLGS
jgi:hypothetical protein